MNMLYNSKSSLSEKSPLSPQTLLRQRSTQLGKSTTSQNYYDIPNPTVPPPHQNGRRRRRAVRPLISLSFCLPTKYMIQGPIRLRSRRPKRILRRSRCAPEAIRRLEECSRGRCRREEGVGYGRFYGGLEWEPILGTFFFLSFFFESELGIWEACDWESRDEDEKGSWWEDSIQTKQLRF